MQHRQQNTAQETAIEDAMTLIDGLELPYLVALSKRLAEHIEKRRVVEIAEARRRIEIIAQQVGVPIDELFRTPVSGKKGTRPPRYTDPRDPSRTWSGTGRKPFWFRELESDGYTLDQLQTPDAASRA